MPQLVTRHDVCLMVELPQEKPERATLELKKNKDEEDNEISQTATLMLMVLA